MIGDPSQVFNGTFDGLDILGGNIVVWLNESDIVLVTAGIGPSVLIKRSRDRSNLREEKSLTFLLSDWIKRSRDRSNLREEKSVIFSTNSEKTKWAKLKHPKPEKG